MLTDFFRHPKALTFALANSSRMFFVGIGIASREQTRMSEAKTTSPN